jgi:hypothetical protein
MGTSKNQNGGKNHNALRIMALLLKFKTNADEARVKGKGSALCFYVGSCL